jgi:hypothetical protein
MPVDVSRVDTNSAMGATVQPGGTAFRTWAPHARNVSVVTGHALSASTCFPGASRWMAFRRELKWRCPQTAS